MLKEVQNRDDVLLFEHLGMFCKHLPRQIKSVWGEYISCRVLTSNFHLEATWTERATGIPSWSAGVSGEVLGSRVSWERYQPHN